MEQDLAKGKEIIMILTKKLKDFVDASGIEKVSLLLFNSEFFFILVEF